MQGIPPIACGCSSPSGDPRRAPLKLITDLHDALNSRPYLQRQIANKPIFVTDVDGRPGLVVELADNSGLFAFARAGRFYALRTEIDPLDFPRYPVIGLTIKFSLEPIDPQDPFRPEFSVQWECNDINDPKSYNASLVAFPGGIDPSQFNWHCLITCAPQCFSCGKKIWCWLGCAASCVASCL
jgi:hypothetical protein